MLRQGTDGSFTREAFVSDLGDSSATDLQFVREGDRLSLFYLSFANGEVRRIEFVGGDNRKPKPALTATPTSGAAPLHVAFDAGGTSDPDGDELAYEWDFGDGSAPVSGVTVQHTYETAGTYTATLTVRDTSGATATVSAVIHSGNTAPEPVIMSPQADRLFVVGETIQLRGSASDDEEGDLPASALSWRVLLHHNTHTHGFVPPTTGSDLHFVAPGPENLEAAATSYLEIQLTATDSAGVSRTVTQELRPRTALVTFAADPAGATLIIDNATVQAPFTVSSWVNYGINVDARTQGGAGGGLQFSGWSDGGAAAHTIVTPAQAATYTATFTASAGPGDPASGVATASSLEAPEFPAANAADGDQSTRWASAYSDPQWIRIDLGAIKDINRVVLSWEAAYATAYSIQVSDDGSSWNTIFSTTTGDGGLDDISGITGRGRFVRMFGTARGTPYGYSLWEFQVFATGGSTGIPKTTPYTGTAVALPGVIQAENFDNGPSGLAYLDGTGSNFGGVYRTTDVDIELAEDTDPSYNVGWIGAGEWLVYTVNVASAGTYALEFRVASASAGATFHLEVNGVDKTGPLVMPNSGGWQSWTTVAKTGVSLSSGPQTWRLVFDRASPDGVVGNVNYIRVVGGGGVTPPAEDTPYNGVRTALPGILQVEHFDEGLAGTVYSDTSAGNAGGELRNTDVDVELCSDAGGGHNVGWIAPGEWLKYSVSVGSAGTYTLEFRVASAAPGGTFHLEVDGVDKTGPLTIPNTGGWQTWTTISKTGISLTAGHQRWRLVIDSAGAVVGNMNYIRVVAGSANPGSGSTPVGGTAASLPGTIQVERFDEGGANVAFADLTAGNLGGEHRDTDVDIETAADAGDGFNIGWVEAGEWLKYTVSIGAAGTYDLDFRVSAPGDGGSFHLEVDGVDKTGPIAVPNTGGWQNWATVTKTGVALPAGTHVLRLVMDADSSAGAVGNFNWFRVVAPSTGGGVAIQRAPYMQSVTATTAVIVWTTKQSGAGSIRYAASTGATVTAPAQTRFYPTTETGMPFDFYQHEARLAGLAPQTRYTYDVLMGGVDVTPVPDQFTTAPPVGSGTVRFIAFGDSGVGSIEQRQLAARMAADSFDLAVHTGDVAYGTADSLGAANFMQYEDWVFSVYQDFMRARPFYPVIGNHDDELDAARPYKEVFVLPENGASSTYPDHAERYYSFDYGPVHFVALDTESAFIDPARRQAQVAWLEADLASTTQPWRVVYMHKPPYSAGPHHGSDLEVRQAFSPLFERYGVQLVVSGHEHVYERTLPRSDFGGSPVTYIVTGGGGGRLTEAGSASWTAFSVSAFHYVRTTVTQCTLTIEGVGIDGVVFDTGQINRCAAPAATPSAGDEGVPSPRDPPPPAALFPVREPDPVE